MYKNKCIYLGMRRFLRLPDDFSSAPELAVEVGVLDDEELT